MIEEINSYLKRFLFLGEDEATVLSAWVLHTWQFEVGRPIVTPYIYLNSPGSGYGKSVTIDVLHTLALNSRKTASITPSALFAMIDQEKCSLLWDEIDTVFHGAKNEDMRNVINNGYKIGNPTYRRSGSLLVKYDAFGPKLMAGIYNGQMPDTIADRCIPISLSMKPVDVELEYFADFLYRDDAEFLLAKIVTWSEEHADQIMGTKLKQIEGFSPRQSEIAWPLLAIAEADGVDLIEPLKRLFDSYEAMRHSDDGVLGKIAEYFDDVREDGIHLDSLVVHLDMPVSQSSIKKLSKQIADSYHIEAKPVRIGNLVRRGYKLEQFWGVFKKHGIKLNNVSM